MKKIKSFEFDHTKLERGIYVSRYDYDIENPNKIIATTFDIRMKLPNREPVLSVKVMHTIEHLVAMFVRNHNIWKDRVIYWGPMGCLTGFYFILQGEYQSSDIQELMKETFEFIKDFEGEIPGATKKECGAFDMHDLEGARNESSNYLSEILNKF